MKNEITDRDDLFLAKIAGRDVDISTMTPPVAASTREKLMLEIAERIKNGSTGAKGEKVVFEGTYNDALDPPFTTDADIDEIIAAYRDNQNAVMRVTGSDGMGEVPIDLPLMYAGFWTEDDDGEEVTYKTCHFSIAYGTDTVETCTVVGIFGEAGTSWVFDHSDIYNNLLPTPNADGLDVGKHPEIGNNNRYFLADNDSITVQVEITVVDGTAQPITVNTSGTQIYNAVLNRKHINVDCVYTSVSMSDGSQTVAHTQGSLVRATSPVDMVLYCGVDAQYEPIYLDNNGIMIDDTATDNWQLHE